MRRPEAGMRNILFIMATEWRNFGRSDRSVFFLQFFLVFFWSAFLVSNALISGSGASPNTIGWIFFAMIVSGNFSNMIFTAERLNGSMEIILTCGLARREILLGKLCFVTGIASIMGAFCYGLSLLWIGIMHQQPFTIGIAGIVTDLGLYAAACYMNAACGAWLSLRLANPRVSYFVSFLIFGVIITVHTVWSQLGGASALSLALILVVLGSVFLAVAMRDFNSERVIQPLNY
jgi:hypothetical protein